MVHSSGVYLFFRFILLFACLIPEEFKIHFIVLIWSPKLTLDLRTQNWDCIVKGVLCYRKSI